MIYLIGLYLLAGLIYTTRIAIELFKSNELSDLFLDIGHKSGWFGLSILVIVLFVLTAVFIIFWPISIYWNRRLTIEHDKKEQNEKFDQLFDKLKTHQKNDSLQ